MNNQPITCRDFISGMPSAFNADDAGDLKAVFYFQVSGDEPGDYTLTIQDGQCTFTVGVPEKADLTIETPSEVWVAVSTGKMNGQTAFMQGKYKAKGNFQLLMKMSELFSTKSD